MHSVTTIFHWPITARALGRWEKWFPWTVVILSPPEAHFCAIRVLAQWNVISVWNFWHTLNAATWFICNKKVCVITSLKREVSKKSVSSSVWRRLVFQVAWFIQHRVRLLRKMCITWYQLLYTCIHNIIQRKLVTVIRNLLFFVANDRCLSQ